MFTAVLRVKRGLDVSNANFYGLSPYWLMIDPVQLRLAQMAPRWPSLGRSRGFFVGRRKVCCERYG